NDTEAVVGTTPSILGIVEVAPHAAITTSGGDSSIIAASDEANLATAKPHGDSDGDNAGVGGSAGVNSLSNTVNAEITDGTSWTAKAGSPNAAGALTVSATGGDSAVTHGENGAGSTDGAAFGIGAAVIVAADTTTTYVGTGGALTASSDVSITSS